MGDDAVNAAVFDSMTVGLVDGPPAVYTKKTSRDSLTTHCFALVFDELQHLDATVEVVSYSVYGDPYDSTVGDLVPVVHYRVEGVSSRRSICVEVLFQLVSPARVEGSSNFYEALGIGVRDACESSVNVTGNVIACGLRREPRVDGLEAVLHEPGSDNA